MHVLFITALALVACLHTASACNNQSFELCTTSQDCASESPDNHNCVRVTEEQEVLECRRGNETDCRCVQSAFTLGTCGEKEDCPVFPTFTECERDADCRQLEVCALTQNNLKLCVGCLGFQNTTRNYTLVEPDSTRCDQPRPPCGQFFDLCSDSLSCQDPLQCLSRDAKGEPVVCTGDTRCNCLTSRFAAVGCTDSSACSGSREVCALNVFQNQNVCATCDAVRNDQNFVLMNESDCDGVQSIPLPKYELGANGLTYDFCRNDMVCTEDRTCQQFRDDFEPKKGTVRCKPGANGLCFCKGKTVRCQFSSDCPTGEYCAIIPRIAVGKSCVSAALIPSVPVTSRTIFGFREIPEGMNLTNDECKFDWDCAGDRRCTHLNDQFGGCAGRNACVCEPLVKPICGSDSDCDEGETCVKLADGKTDPICVSKAYAALDNGFEPLDFEPPAATPVPGDGLTEDPCREDEQCAGDLGCYHVAEFGEPCNGRYNCLCFNVTDEGLQSTSCRTSNDCTEGEICAVIADSFPRSPQCYGRYAFDMSTVLQVAGPRPSPRPSPSLSSSPSISSTPTPSASMSASSSASASASASASISASMSVSPSISESVSPSLTMEVPNGQADSAIVESPETVCIDESLLQHLPTHELVFTSSRRGAVLCDTYGSCATPGHLVTWQGHGMSMRTYCSTHAKCQKRVTWVNSPRMRRGLRIDSRTVGLQFTALAARYETWVEEALLVRLLQLGA